MLEIAELRAASPRTQVVTSHEALVQRQEEWRKALEAKGWASSA